MRITHIDIYQNDSKIKYFDLNFIKYKNIDYIKRMILFNWRKKIEVYFTLKTK